MTQYYDNIVCNACTVITLYDQHYNRKTITKFMKTYKGNKDEIKKHLSCKDYFLNALVTDPERNKFVRDATEEIPMGYMSKRGFKIQNFIDI